jgi:hypothetical protein
VVAEIASPSTRCPQHAARDRTARGKASLGTGGFGTSGLRLDNPRRAVNQLLVWGQRRGETASGKPRRGARLALQAGIGSKRRDAEVPKTRPVAGLRAERGVNGQAEIVAGKRIGSPTQTKGILSGREARQIIDFTAAYSNHAPHTDSAQCGGTTSTVETVTVPTTTRESKSAVCT